MRSNLVDGSSVPDRAFCESCFNIPSDINLSNRWANLWNRMDDGVEAACESLSLVLRLLHGGVVAKAIKYNSRALHGT